MDSRYSQNPTTPDTRGNAQASARIAEQAAEWALALDEGSQAQRRQTRRDFERWQQADPAHACAARKVEAFIGQASQLHQDHTPAARRALNAGLTYKPSNKSQTQRIAKGVAGSTLVLLLGLMTLIIGQHYPWQHLNADLMTQAGECQTQQLADGTLITLSGKSAVDIEFNRQQRIIRLLSGEIRVDVAPDRTRPFIVRSEYGDITALGTRFIVNQRTQATHLAMLESKVRVSSHATGAGKPAENRVVITAGEQLELLRQGLGEVRPLDVQLQQQRWNNRQLVVNNRPLAEVLAELQRFHPAYIHFNAEQLQGIQVSAVLPLDQPDQALQLLASRFEQLHISKLTPWLVRVSRQ